MYHWPTSDHVFAIDRHTRRNYDDVGRAAQPMPTELGTLDAIHLATALLWKDMTGVNLVMATHDAALALGAEAHGLPVVGVRR